MGLKESPSERKKVTSRDTTTSVNLLNAFNRPVLLRLLLGQDHSPSLLLLILPLKPTKPTSDLSTRLHATSTSSMETSHLPLSEPLTLPLYLDKNWFTSALSEKTLSTMLSSEKKLLENSPISLPMSLAPTVSFTL